jgi:pyruvate dehydrogenase complex dehydrogenase (E1) component
MLESKAAPVVATTNCMRNYADQIRSHIVRLYVVLGTTTSAAATIL